MSRPAQNTPTEGELEILRVLWDRGPCTVRDVHAVLTKKRKRAYTSVMGLMTIMATKKFVVRELEGRAYLYRPRIPREKTLGRIVGDLIGRAFGGSASELMVHALEQSQPTQEELDAIRRAIDDYTRQSDTGDG